MQVVTGIWGDKFPRSYINLLRAMVPDIIILGEDRARLCNYQGWWGKLELFAPWHASLRPCLWLDLDTYVLGDITPLRELSDELWLLDDFNIPSRGESGIMVVPTACEAIWAGAAAAITAHRGDGPYLATFAHKRLQSAVDGIKSYKTDQLYAAPGNARIVCFHGKPRPHECDGWAKEFFDARTTRSQRNAGAAARTQ
jgi:hypothetical protein